MSCAALSFVPSLKFNGGSGNGSTVSASAKLKLNEFFITRGFY